ncbi:hypothetical protein OGAPHI_002809 [Ogataea philodendri]|uniref:Uncharacterized protein n=1 Tax=Ogataea philodendri TaxID=1378263 RepID=A0A9P8T6J4_9ASCO|nr:uncharacterized protein OGAPHI_002809 [Ogataea philodendri]KAH3667160.1 hypothetical protein OGAPHI_002809 [Ogataea philodendri]
MNQTDTHDLSDMYSNLQTLEQAVCNWRQQQQKYKEVSCKLWFHNLELPKDRKTRFVSQDEVSVFVNGQKMDGSHTGDLIVDFNTGDDEVETTVLTFLGECVLPSGWQLQPNFTVGCYLIAANSVHSQMFVSMTIEGLVDSSGVERTKSEFLYETDTVFLNKSLSEGYLKLDMGSTTQIKVRQDPAHKLFNTQLFKILPNIQTSSDLFEYCPGNLLLRTSLISGFANFLNFVLNMVTLAYFKRLTTITSTLSNFCMLVASLSLTTLVVLLHIDATGTFQQLTMSYKYFFYWWFVVAVHFLISVAIGIYFFIADEKYIMSKVVSGRRMYVNDRPTMEFVIFFQLTTSLMVLLMFTFSVLKAKRRLNNFLNLTIKCQNTSL